MMESDPPVLIHCDTKDAEYSKIFITKSEYAIGRSRTATFIIPSLLVSKNQCVFEKKDQDWTICDKSSFGTFINGVQLAKDVPAVISDGSRVEFGPTGKFKFIFYTKNIPSSSAEPPIKKRRTGENDSDSQRTQPYYEDEKNEIELKYRKHVEELQEKHSQEMKALQTKLQLDNAEQEIMSKKKQELEEQQAQERKVSDEKLLEEKKSLEDKIKEMQNLLEEKDKAQELLNQKLQEKEEQRLRDLKLLQEQQDQQVKNILENLKKEVAEKEDSIRIQLENELQKLHDEKTKLENDISGKVSKLEGESAENLKHLQEELEKVKKDLIQVEGKKQYLEKELEDTKKAKGDAAAASSLEAKQEVLQNFGELMETELQCSICNELFVTAMTLNCTHTFCKSCIMEWKKKKKDCPICRTKITSENRSIALDNFIERMVSNLSEELKHRREEIVEERQVQELLGSKQKPDSTTESRNRRRRRGENANAISSSSNSDTISQGNNNDIIVISSESSESESDSSRSSNLSWDDEDEDEDGDEDYMEGNPRAYYGGYGHCYRCGRRGHWARGCPD